MENWLGKAWEFMQRKLGAFSSLIPALGRDLDIAIAAGDTTKILEVCEQMEARSREGREMFDAQDEFTAHVRKSVDDGRIDLIEGAEGARLFQRYIDEAEDVITGRDEDDAPPVGGGDDPPDIHQP